MQSFFGDIFNAIKQSSLDRIKSPFWGTFIFCWLGFNWQMLAILFFSKQNIITKLDYINSYYGVSSYITAPIFTTFLICFLLPKANKAIAKLQRKTITETTLMALDDRIEVAEKQHQIAVFEAKKKLAEERERKNIESNIDAIIEKHELLIKEHEDLKAQLLSSQRQSENLAINTSTLNSKLMDIEKGVRELKAEQERQRVTTI